MIKRLDEALGRTNDALKSLDLTDNTIVLYTSDHACHFKTRNSEYKRSGHESSVRVPTAFAGPGFEMGGRRQEVVSLIDLVPTLLDASGIKPPEIMPGRSLMPRIRGSTEDWDNCAFIQISESQVARAIRTKRWKYGVVAHDKDGETESCSDAYSEDYLYDLKSDPYELQNLIAFQSHGPLCDHLRALLLREMNKAGEEAPTIVEKERNLVGQRKVFEHEITE